MDNASNLLTKANKSLEIADHLAFVTYPMVKEPKLGYTITEHALTACLNAIDALLFYEYTFKRTGYPPDQFAAKIDLMKRQIAPRYNIDRKHIFIIEDMHNLLEYRKKSPIEFVKKDALIICDRDYEYKTMSIEKIKNYVYESKGFLSKINSLLKSRK